MTRIFLIMSAILSADDLNDFISPGVACIKPVAEVPHAGEVEIQIDENGRPLEISKIDGKINQLAPAQISLADCLACSGCITSAEEILVAQHSHDELVKVLRERDPSRVFVASISHQARASLATAYKLAVEDIDRLLVNLFVGQMGFSYVVGTSFGRKLLLIYEAQNIAHKKGDGPLLSSICPGWVLYAEKTHPYILPRMSETKSPQQITGCLLKTLAAHELNTPRENIYHLSIMPCFDKKLESARPELGEPGVDVDCVLTPKELVTLLDQYSDQFQLIPGNANEVVADPTPIGDIYAKYAPTSWPLVDAAWASDDGSASGGYAYNYIVTTRTSLILEDPISYREEDFTIVTVPGRNPDVYEIRLMHHQEKVASAAVVNGFKNIQNLVRKFKPQATKRANPLVARRRARQKDTSDPDFVAEPSKCDYVEVMACPNGCINGGGQIAPPKDVSEKQWLENALNNYNSIPKFAMLTLENAQHVAEVLNWTREFCGEFQIPESRLLHTHFAEVEKPTDPNAILLGAKW